MTATSRETEIGERVVPWLRDMNWDVHQEVAMSTGGRRADIVAVRGKLLWVIEMKQMPGLALLDQVYHWLGFAHYVSAASPRYPRSRSAFDQFCRQNGIGYLIAGLHEVRHDPPPVLHRRVLDHYLRAALCEETRTWAAAGNALSDYYSPFRRTVRRIQDVLRAAPDGLTMREIVANVDHHYSSDASARGALRHWIIAGKIPGLVGDSGRPERWRLAVDCRKAGSDA